MFTGGRPPTARPRKLCQQADVIWVGGSPPPQPWMRVLTRRAVRRWAVVAAGVGILCGLPAVVAALPVPGSELTAAQLRARIAASATVSYQGYAQSYVDLGLPSLPDLGNVISLLDGSTDQYVWYRSPGQWRADQLTAAGENDIYQTSRGTYQWNYTNNELTRVVGAQPVRLPQAPDLLPPDLARRLVGLASRATRFTRLPAQRIAGVDAAGLRLVPVDSASTISQVEIWADPRTGLPVQVEVFGAGDAAPLLVSRFLDLSETTPAAATLTPQPGPGIDLATTTLPDAEGVLNGFGPPLPAQLGWIERVANPAGLSDVAAYGAGFSRFAVVPLPARAGDAALSAASSAGLTVTLGAGTAVVVQTPLIAILLARSPDGQVYLLTGTVTASRLEYAATQLLESQ